MKKLKLMTIVGTRPEIIRLSEFIKKADSYFEHIFVHTGQNYDYNLNEVFYKDLQLRTPNYYLNVVGDNLGETMGNIIAKTYELMRKIEPDALLILGDTNSALSAISAKRLKIPIFHMEAGNRCFDENLPEETNRRIVDHISDVNLAYTEHARRYLLAEGVRKEHIYVTGSPITEVIYANKAKFEESKVLEELSLEKKKYILLSAHREENIDIEDNFFSLMNAINAMAERYKLPIIYSVHPRSASLIKKRNFKFHDLVKQLPPFSFTDYGFLQQNAFCVLSDSGTLPEEASICRFPAVSIRTSTERPEALDKGGFIMGGITEQQILQSVEIAVSMAENDDYGSAVSDYLEKSVSSTVIRIIQSYTKIINKKVWGK
ncbi:UDP-N-acetylglucosamine 2-epimerase (non-hydrolyzing) [Clostridium beijerinckii]|uniref:non-hydrolyzing UDP-N-acetylglucosamine 2-epimerase n=1 Tax=Clostridium beijerinckii TaxID=1520 RepID=UPI002226AF64|nr:UDP-N-acetylglucosamine 2-epimerase (non-hydrolyzing) [Clostridium beijerinckii]UYZ34255.1 UDP-N-acetylglucosamine 2-epimerase (non-hydrolyzing) [Clostridium beijerinckii]